jgi:hypothetical protein
VLCRYEARNSKKTAKELRVIEKFSDVAQAAAAEAERVAQHVEARAPAAAAAAAHL